MLNLKPHFLLALIQSSTGWTSGFTNIIETRFPISRPFIYDYMVQTVKGNDGKLQNNFRALKTGYNLFASGHVQSLFMNKTEYFCFYEAPSMK